MANERCSIQLIDGDGVFNVTSLEHFMKSVKLAEHGFSYAVVSIMGPQSSGMSLSFLNFIFVFYVLEGYVYYKGSNTTFKMQNEASEMMNLYILRKCSATNRLITAKDHASVQINIGHLDDNGVYTGQYTTFALSGFIRAQSMDGVNAEDFFTYGLDKPDNTINKLGSNVHAVNVNAILGLNTLGISMARIDFGPRGLNPPHTHPRAIEILTMLEGELYVGFVTSNIGQTNHFSPRF
ncbi:hypothetical protein ZIOFF_046882 [Zingiber officinale]|uniref:Cupin type-1 domain-containing protein n=1 Tax=Zingiber officinale TaxID=94328 RepID=A0A8J5KJF3_ZINOF|nr:hypothetical protein ZIOFF_046882 [Zingiber officinale]